MIDGLQDRIDLVVLHCSDSPHRGDRAIDVHRWHLERGWHGCGYHWIISEDGREEAGRPWYWVGSHVFGHNRNSLGILLFGVDEFTDQQIGALVELYNKIRAEWPDAIWKNHRDLDSSKTCPNQDLAGMLTGRPTR